MDFPAVHALVAAFEAAHRSRVLRPVLRRYLDTPTAVDEPCAFMAYVCDCVMLLYRRGVGDPVFAKAARIMDGVEAGLYDVFVLG